MLFEGGNDFCGATHFSEKIQIKRFQRSHAGHAAADTPTLKLRCRFHGQRQGVAQCENPHLFAFAKAQGFPDFKIGLRFVDNRLTLFSDADVDRPGIIQGGMKRRAQFFLVPWREDSQTRDQAQHTHFFDRVMRGSERRIGKSGTGADKNDTLMMVTKVEADLLDDAIGEERGDGVADWTQSARRHAGGNAHHVGFGHAAVEEPPWRYIFKFVEQAVSDVTRKQNDVLALLRDLGDFVRKCVTHGKS